MFREVFALLFGKPLIDPTNLYGKPHLIDPNDLRAALAAIMEIAKCSKGKGCMHLRAPANDLNAYLKMSPEEAMAAVVEMQRILRHLCLVTPIGEDGCFEFTDIGRLALEATIKECEDYPIDPAAERYFKSRMRQP
jgi:hypothetical protein